ncbi:transcriptional regulator [Arthrobacter sp. SW1]|uniref:helix-turn-helix transcriptional regulator n=1 Tax=Arthrobacter sp. SW1 TaxID=1920889 RepID=UPI000877E76A|nr:helix-turn-helix domain-containing protein [Arthrobacter sp. SW1]OFI39861.1 transcriptional regulator [Arthrobacter sp. SW1]
MTGLSWRERLSALSSLGDESRRRLYEYVSSMETPTGRDEAAAALGMPRSTASFHLDRLVRDGLLGVEFRKPVGKGGPGSGRPAKFYVPLFAEIGASVPERNYDLAGSVLAAAVSSAMDDDGGAAREALLASARAKGAEAAAGGRDFLEVLAAQGYQPEPDDAGGHMLVNCPFHKLSRSHPEVVCAMNGAFLAGVAESCGVEGTRISGDDRPGHCCARILPAEGDR